MRRSATPERENRHVEVVLTPKAERDLEAIADRIAVDNPERALTFLDELYAACMGLAEFPARFPLVTAHAARGIRRRIHGNYLIFYRHEPERVRVLHVLHATSDYDSLLH